MGLLSRRKAAKRQHTDVLPLGDAIELYVHTLHRSRKPMLAEERTVADRLRADLNTALNAFEVKLTLGCEFRPDAGPASEDFEPAGDEPATMAQRMAHNAHLGCCGVVRRTPGTFGT